MATKHSLYRVPVLIFAMLVGGLYVYAKGGGSLSPRPQVTPAASVPGEALAPPKIEFMMGPKSAPVFDRQNDTPRQPAPPASNTAPQYDSTKYGTPRRSTIIAAPVQLPAQSQTVQPRLRVLPGSKSAIVIDPQTIAPVQQRAQPAPNYQRPVQPAPQPAPRANVLPGSKSAGIIGPEAFAQPKAPQNQVPRNNAAQQNSVVFPRNYVPPPGKNTPQNNVPRYNTNVGPSNIAPNSYRQSQGVSR